MPKNILLVEDSLDQQRMYTTALEYLGYAVQTAYTGHQALNQCRQSSFDLVILDIGLAGSLDGLEVVSQLKAGMTTAAIPILVMSAYPDNNLSQMARVAGAVQFLAKPFLITQLFDHVEHILQVGHQRPARADHTRLGHTRFDHTRRRVRQDNRPWPVSKTTAGFQKRQRKRAFRAADFPRPTGKQRRLRHSVTTGTAASCRSKHRQRCQRPPSWVSTARKASPAQASQEKCPCKLGRQPDHKKTFMTTSASTISHKTLPGTIKPLVAPVPSPVATAQDSKRAQVSSVEPALLVTPALMASSTPSVSDQIDQGRARRLLDRALTLSQRGDTAAAIVACRQAVSLAAHDACGFSILGMLLEQVRDTNGAITAYEKVMDRAPDSTVERESLQRLRVKRRHSQAAAGALASDVSSYNGINANAVNAVETAPDSVRVHEGTTVHESATMHATHGVSNGAAGDGDKGNVLPLVSPELSALASASTSPRRLLKQPTFYSRVLPLVVVSALSLLAIVWTRQRAQSPATMPEHTTVPLPATGVPQTANAGTSAHRVADAPVGDPSGDLSGDGANSAAGATVATGTAATSIAGASKPSPYPSVAEIGTRVAVASVRTPRSATSLPAQRPTQRTGDLARRPDSRVAPGAARTVVQPGNVVVPASSHPQAASRPQVVITLPPVSAGVNGAGVNGGGASLNGKPFNPNGSASRGYIRIAPWRPAAS